jgi:hypothetical protein
MNVTRYENETRKAADKIHERAQRSGEEIDYRKAAELYERCGDYRAARVCRDAAEALGKAKP